MAYRGLFIEHSCTSSIGPRGLILLVHVLIERSSLSGSSISLCDPGRVLCDPTATKYADPGRKNDYNALNEGHFGLFAGVIYIYPSVSYYEEAICKDLTWLVSCSCHQFNSYNLLIA